MTIACIYSLNTIIWKTKFSFSIQYQPYRHITNDKLSFTAWGEQWAYWILKALTSLLLMKNPIPQRKQYESQSFLKNKATLRQL